MLYVTENLYTANEFQSDSYVLDYSSMPLYLIYHHRNQTPQSKRKHQLSLVR